MSHALPLQATLEYTISQVKDRRFSERHAVVAAQNLIKIPSVMEVWLWGNLENETHLSILLGVPDNVFKQYADFLKQAPCFNEQSHYAQSMLLVMHRIATAKFLNPEAFWIAIEETEKSTGCERLSDSMFIMLVPQRWNNPSNHKLLQTALCLPDIALVQSMVTTAHTIKQRLACKQ